MSRIRSAVPLFVSQWRVQCPLMGVNVCIWYERVSDVLLTSSFPLVRSVGTFSKITDENGRCFLVSVATEIGRISFMFSWGSFVLFVH